MADVTDLVDVEFEIDEEKKEPEQTIPVEIVELILRILLRASRP